METDTSFRRRKQVEEKLHESEEKYRTLVELSPDAIVLECDEQVVFVNSAGVKLFGALSADDLLGKSIFDLVAGDDRPRLSERLQQVRQSDTKMASEEGKWLRLDGTVFDAELAAGRFTVGGQPAAQIVLRDITERKRIQTRSAAFSALGHRLSSASTQNEAARMVAEIADQLLGWDACYLQGYTDDYQSIIPVLNLDTIGGRRQEVPMANADLVLSPLDKEIIERGARLILRPKPDVADKGLIPFGDTARPSASLMFVPIRKGARVMGILSVQSYRAGAYSETDLASLQALADHCGGALERIRAAEALALVAHAIESTSELMCITG